MLPGGGPLGGPCPGGGPWNGCKHNEYMNAKDTFQVTKYDTIYTYKQQLTQETHNTTIRPMTLLT